MIHNYSYTPSPLHFFLMDWEDEYNTLTYGFELEVNRDPDEVTWMESCSYFVSNRFLPYAAGVFGFEAMDNELFYCKKDSSVGDGFEIVSSPMSWNWFMANVDKFEKIIRFLQDNHYVSEKGGKCGLHFHIGDRRIESMDESWTRCNPSREYDQLLHYASNMQKIMSFYKKELISFSRRKPEQIVRWCALDENPDFQQTRSKVKKDLKKGRHDDRYKALNTTNSSTLEIRLMRGTTNWKTFFLTYNLVKNLAEYSLCDNKPISWEMLVFTGLDEVWRKIAQEYLSKRKIVSPKRAVYTESYKAKRKDMISARIDAILG